ncbi:soma ferritin-like [Ptychodera flava]|uniref:soma ferritin-like n=1 Tax=Ptychodera flava TaxID=63121 RepID=UPI00396A31EB
MSLCRQNYHEECEAAINKQINLELYASYVYQSLAYHFDRDDVALPGMHKYFKRNSDEEREHAEKLMELQNKRGGRICLQDVRKPTMDDWGTALAAMESALDLEKHVNQSLLELHSLVSAKTDPHLSDFIEGEFLKEQVESIKEMSDMITNLKRVGSGVGEFLFDKELDKKLSS